MPCHDPEPSERDERAQLVAGLILGLVSRGYVAEKVVSTDYGILDTLLGTPWPIGAKYLDDMTDTLCQICQHLPDSVVQNFDEPFFKELSTWWRDHQAADAGKSVKPWAPSDEIHDFGRQYLEAFISRVEGQRK